MPEDESHLRLLHGDEAEAHDGHVATLQQGLNFLNWRQYLHKIEKLVFCVETFISDEKWQLFKNFKFAAVQRAAAVRDRVASPAVHARRHLAAHKGLELAHGAQGSYRILTMVYHTP